MRRKQQMPNTYTQLYIQFVFAVKYRHALIASKWKDDLHKYITGIVQNKGSKMLAINGMPDHIHIFFGYDPAFSYSRSQIHDVCTYIENQELHHKTKTFREEYISFLKAFEIA